MSERASTKGRERPILFSAPMVRALLDGRKTQTRRLIKPQPVVHPAGNWSWEGRNGGFVGAAGTHVDEGFPETARFYARFQPGDVIWVREAWRAHLSWDVDAPRDVIPAAPIWYEAAPFETRIGLDVGKLRPSIFMPRWASRLTLTVTDVRVQRLQDISGNDAQAEGISIGGPDVDVYRREADRNHEAARRWNAYRIRQYRDVWEAINGAGSWEANPWVAAYTFTVEHRNIDEGLGQRADATQNPLSEGRERS